MKTSTKTGKTSKQRTSPNNGVISRDDLSEYLFDYLGVAKIKDYCPNGLQVEVSLKLRKLSLGSQQVWG
jgi:hypothetical protein